MLLFKKISQRNCSFRKLKVADLFDSFKWDELIDFRMKAPYVPEALDLSKQLQIFSHNYENMIQVLYT
jgi:hypothetical protein